MEVKIARIYLSEDSPLLNEIFTYLHEQHIKGATLFRGVKGFGSSGKTREARFLDLHMDLPMVIEFFDEPSRINAVLNYFQEKIGSGRILQWLAEVD
ncbi:MULTISPECIES: DUF190 domain-containing protein [Legionella]|uniref:DUF190 domain-containing protein n=1 Tax=Legionella septentrionalis TaxID=2498109 RepID=A0A433JJB9_9GAMM|nr:MULTISPECIES: DUF190 domain-containing protein [Legionella]MCP0913169.1 DUF190 domain-containing protein [Legionella sp. 27cVA30]RUQ88068.1 DUF190 domain-containing protein [Legionella septentrionalis]RUR02447.1 DUF190 domain-containing protein [Legionella septentrionalis]RUR09304.1 DUF190 domain-containing protein [Legionella septentrionalis]RUR17105.1 DUF190 domain-containing protein [Legionella septentrionalis]